MSSEPPSPVVLQNTPTRLSAHQADAVFHGILRDQTPRIFALACAITGDWHASQDIVQETFIKLHAQLHKMAVDGRILAWTRQVATHAAIDFVRSRKGQPGPMDPVEVEAVAGRGVDPIVRQYCRDLLEHIAKLPLQKREIVELRIWDRLRYSEISQRVGCSVDRARKVFERFRTALRRIES